MIRLRMLGSAELSDSSGREVEFVLRRPKLLALLAYLAAARPYGFQRRDGLLSMFWPELDQPHARNALRQSVHLLRDALGRDVLIARGEEELGLDPQRLSCDVTEFVTCLDSGDGELALALYRGELLAAFHVSEAPELERWLELERQYLRRRATEAAMSLVESEASRSNTLRAARWARRALEISPSDEGALRGLLRLLDAAGNRAEAIHEYDAFARRLQSDLDLEPAPETAALAMSIRARIETLGSGEPSAIRPAPSETLGATAAGAPMASSSHPVVPATDSGAHLPRHTRWRWPFAAGGALIALTSVLAVMKHRAPPSLDSNLLAVAPFDVLDSKLALWREGLVDILTRNLDGAGSLRTVAPTVIVRRWQGRAQRQSAQALGYQTNARFVVFGNLLDAGPDSVRLTCSLLDAQSGRSIVEVDRVDHLARIDRLVDSVSLDVIRVLVPSAPEAHHRLYSLGTRSVPALKAFLKGEYFFRRFALDSALVNYHRATAIDTTFALAFRRTELVDGWMADGDNADDFLRAAAMNHGLGPRDSLLVLSDSGANSPASVANHPAFRSVARRKFAVLEEAARRYPEDPEVWYQLGEARFHAGYVVDASWSDARQAFDRAIALDSGFAPAYIHPVEIALNDDDADAARRYVQGYLAISSVIPEGGAMRLLARVLGSGTPSHDMRQELDATPNETLRLLGLAVRSWPDSNETQLEIWPHLLAAARVRVAAGDTSLTGWVKMLRYISSSALVHRGHLSDARGLVGDRFDAPFMELALLGAIPPQLVEQRLDAWFAHPPREQRMLNPRLVDVPCSRTMDAAWWWALRKDTIRLRRLARREEMGMPDDAVPSIDVAGRRRVPGFVRAALALARGDTALALNGMLAFPDSLCADASQLRQARFRLLLASGRDREAATVFDRSHDRQLPLVLDRARVAERLGDRRTAVKYYRFVAHAWAHADVELQPIVTNALAAAERLDR